MHRDYLLALLDRYQATTNTDAAAKQEITQFVLANTDCFKRELLIGHVTAGAWLLNKDLSKVLLMLHAKHDMWCQLGGHADGDANILNVAIREAQEESGIKDIIPVSLEIFDLDVHDIPAMHGEPAHKHYDVRFLLKVDSDEKEVINSESKDLRWFAMDEAQLPTKAEAIVRMFRKWRNLCLSSIKEHF